MEFNFGEFPGHSRTGIPLQYMNFLVLLELWHGARSCIKMCPFWDISLYIILRHAKTLNVLENSYVTEYIF